MSSLAGIDPQRASIEYRERRIETWSDARLVSAAATILAIPKAGWTGSFVLHAPLELLARAGLLKQVAPAARERARQRMVWMAASYEAVAPGITAPAAIGFVSARQGAAALIAALGRGELDEVDRVAVWLAAHASAAELRALLAEAVIPFLSAAAHAAILLYLLPRIAPGGELTNDIIRGPLRHLALDPASRLRGHETAGDDDGAGTTVPDLLDLRRLGLPPGGARIAPLLLQAESSGLVVKKGSRQRRRVASSMPTPESATSTATRPVPGSAPSARSPTAPRSPTPSWLRESRWRNTRRASSTSSSTASPSSQCAATGVHPEVYSTTMQAPLRILLVDDDPTLTAAYARSLAAMRPDWQVATVNSGAEAMRLLERSAFDVLVTDISMPGVDGLDLLHWAEHYLPGLTRVVVSGVIDGRTLIETASLAKAHLVKPFPAERLVERIEDLRSPRVPLIHIVDDSDHDRALVSTVLAGAIVRARIEGFSDGEPFLERFAAPGERPDLVVLDITMPLVGGIEVLRALQLSGQKTFPIIVFSCEGVAFEMPLCERLGADVCLYKPSAYAEYHIVATVARGLLRRRGLIA